MIYTDGTTDPSIPNSLLSDPTLSPSIDIPALDTAPLTATNIADVAGNVNVSPVANSNNSGGFDINDVTKTITTLFDDGVSVFNHVAQVTGTPQLGSQASKPTTNPSLTFGLSQTQWLIIAGGIGVLGLALLLRRR